jgi:hypothetical protein
LKLTERSARNSENEIEFTVDDPSAYEAAFTVRVDQLIVADGSR